MTSEDNPDVIDALQALIRFDTTNWGGGRSAGERECAEWIASLLIEAGYDPVVLARDDAPDRGNCVVRVRGTDAHLPGLVVHAHLDVVPAEADQWSVDPFGGIVRDGWIWGRGSVDMLDTAASVLTTLLQWSLEGVRPRRDIVVAFVADEEDAGEYGAEWLVREHADLFAGCGAAIGEDGAIAADVTASDGHIVRFYPIACAERGTMHVRLTARGSSGHASRPSGSDAVRKLVDAVHRIAHHDWPMRMSPVVRAQVQEMSAALGYPVDADDEASVLAAVAAMGPAVLPLPYTLRASATPTMLTAGYKVNVVPGIATAEIDVRCPPGAHDEVEATLIELIGPDVDWTYTAHQRPIEAPYDTEWFARMTACILRADPTGVVVPLCMGGGTDGKAFAKLGLLTYGFTPVMPDPEGRRPMNYHGVDERNTMAGVVAGQKVMRAFLES